MNTQQNTAAQDQQEDIVGLWRRSWSGDPAARQAFLRRIMPASAFPEPAIVPFAVPRPRPDRAAA